MVETSSKAQLFYESYGIISINGIGWYYNYTEYYYD